MKQCIRLNYINFNYTIINKLICYLKISFLVILLFVSNNFLLANEIYLIRENKVYTSHSDLLKAREESKKIAFDLAFKKLLEKIIPFKDQEVISNIQENDLNSYVSDFTIKKEDYFDKDYNALIDVNFNPDKINTLLSKYGINISSTVSEEFLVLPIYYNLNTYFFWEKNNQWYKKLREKYKNDSLLKLYFPDLGLLNKFIISSKEALDSDIEKFDAILKKYNRNSAIVIFFEERYDFEFENFISKIKLTIFTEGEFVELKLKNKNLINNISSKSAIDLISELSLLELDNWWKNKITVTYNDKEELNNYLVNLKFENLKESIKIQKLLENNAFVIQLIPTNISKNNITYQLSSYGSLEKLKLALKSNKLELKESGNKSVYQLLRLN